MAILKMKLVEADLTNEDNFSVDNPDSFSYDSVARVFITSKGPDTWYVPFESVVSLVAVKEPAQP